jgi:hypothetical protein
MLLLGLFVWSLAASTRALVPISQTYFKRASHFIQRKLEQGIVRINDVEGGRHASIQNIVAKRRSAFRGARLRFVQQTRKAKGLQRFAFQAVRRPHHAHSHSR